MINVNLIISEGVTVTELGDSGAVISFAFITSMDTQDVQDVSIPRGWRDMYRWRRWVKQIEWHRYIPLETVKILL